MSEMVERVARAIRATIVSPLDSAEQVSAKLARAAIEALREPTERMVDAGAREIMSLDTEFDNALEISKDVLIAAIDAALTPPEPE